MHFHESLDRSFYSKLQKKLFPTVDAVTIVGVNRFVTVYSLGGGVMLVMCSCLLTCHVIGRNQRV